MALVFFMKFEDETKKVSGNPANLDELFSMFQMKFSTDAPREAISFSIEDQQYHVPHKLEDCSEIYGGAVIEVKIQGSKGKDDLKRELEEMKRKLNSLQDNEVPRKRQRIEGEPPKAELATTFVEPETSAGPPGGPPAGSPPAMAPPTTKVIRMRGLPFSAMESQVKEFFGDVPPSAVHMPQDQLGRPKGEAYAEFADEDEVKKAMAHDRESIGHRYIELFPSSHQELDVAMGKVTRYGGGSHGGGAVAARMDAAGETCLRMQGLPYQATEVDITGFFQNVGITPSRIHRKRNSGDSYVEFGSVEETKQAMTLQKQYMGHRYIEMYRVSYREMAETVGLPPQQHRPSQPYNPYGGYENYGYGYVYDPSMQGYDYSQQGQVGGAGAGAGAGPHGYPQQR